MITQAKRTPGLWVDPAQVREWFQRAADNAEAFGKPDSAALWRDGLAIHDAQAARIAELEEALTEGTGRDYDPAMLRDLANSLIDNAPIIGRDKELSAQIISDFGRFIRVARAILAKKP